MGDSPGKAGPSCHVNVLMLHLHTNSCFHSCHAGEREVPGEHSHFDLSTGKGHTPPTHIGLAKASHMTTQCLGNGEVQSPKYLEDRRPDIGKQWRFCPQQSWGQTPACWECERFRLWLRRDEKQNNGNHHTLDLNSVTLITIPVTSCDVCQGSPGALSNHSLIVSTRGNFVRLLSGQWFSTQICGPRAWDLRPELLALGPLLQTLSLLRGCSRKTDWLGHLPQLRPRCSPF